MDHSGNKLFAVCCLMVSLNVEVMLTSSEPVFVVVISDVIATNNQNIVPILKEITSHKRPRRLQFVTVVFKNDTEAVDTVCSLISSGAAGLIDLSSPKLSPLLLALSKDLGVAYISMVDSSYYYYYHFMSDRAGQYADAAEIAVDIAGRWEKLNSVALFYDDTFDIQNTPRRVLTNVPVPHIYLPLSTNTSQTERQIDTLIKINIKTVLIIADRFSAQSFLSVDSEKYWNLKLYDRVFIIAWGHFPFEHSESHMSLLDELRFGPFKGHKVNASWVSVQELYKIGLGLDQIELVIVEIPVIYEEVKKIIPELWKKYNPVLMVHVGVSGVATELTLEQRAHNDGYTRDDVQGMIPHTQRCVDDFCENVIVSGIDMNQVCVAVNSTQHKVTSVVSQDPGRYLCDFTYFQSLHINKSCTAFIHVPPLDKYPASELAQGLQLEIRRKIQYSLKQFIFLFSRSCQKGK
ncbi:Pyroglutamyl-peptidase 1 [Bulinus truncatus]|nr:Pyroglutamyl-peptidase 1 [Bulinus truncatus]